jgi:hypothetical protein
VQTLVSKILVVVVLISSLSFMGFAIAAYLGGPNWNAEMLELEGVGEFKGFQFNFTDGPQGKWTATRGRDNQSIASSAVAPEVIKKALEAATKEQQEKLQQLQESEQRLTALKAAYEKNQATDEAALDVRRVELLKQVEVTRARVSELAKQVSLKTEEAQAIEQRIGERREDVIRLRAQLTEIRTDVFRLEELRQELTDQLQQLLASLDRAKERQQRLTEEVVGKN